LGDRGDESSGGTGQDRAQVNVSGFTVQAGIEEIELLAVSGGALTALGATHNTIYGSAFDDTLNGLGGNDLLYGGAGNDTLMGGTGNDTMYGGAGDDTYRIDQASDVADETGGAGVDRARIYVSDVTVGAGIERANLYGGGTLTAANGDGVSLLGSVSTDHLIGADGTDRLFGGGGADTLEGGGGNDFLYGGDGIDSLLGGAGNDTMTGSTGADVFVRGSGEGNDRILDFSSAQGDKVDLDGVTLVNTVGNVATLSDGGTITAQAGYVWTGSDFV